MDKEILEKNELHWYVMWCQKADYLGGSFEAYNTECPDTGRIEDYFIPSAVIKARPLHRHDPGDEYTGTLRPGEDADIKNNKMRNTLRRFVFLRVRPSAFDLLAAQKWNADRTRLYHYRNSEGNAVIASDGMMKRFIDACLEYGGKFDVITTTQQISEGITVTVRRGAFKDLEAQVLNIQFRGDGIRFTMAVRLFADNYAYVRDCTVDDVIVHNEDNLVFSTDYLDSIQDSIFAILRLRVNGRETEEQKEDNTLQLRKLYRLRHASIANELLAVRFDALMSICASLTRNESGKTKYNRIIKRRLKAVRNQESTETTQKMTAYLLTALFISTRDPEYRTELKTLVSDHLSYDQQLRAAVSLIRKL